MATVITNLFSAIPWIGQDLVEFLWGGLYTDEPHYNNVMLKILVNAGISSIFGFTYVLYLITLLFIYVKIVKTWRQSAGVRSIHTFEASQRLHTEDPKYAYLVGLFEGKGFFTYTKKGKYLTYELGIELSIKDIQLIYKIKNLLGIGVISFRKINDINMVSLRIRDKKHLKLFIFPIFDKYPMFSNKQYDYLRFKDALLSNIIYYKDLPEDTRTSKNKEINSKESILVKSYFPAWLVGFIEAEGCFSVYNLNKDKDSLIASFYIAQKDGDVLISAIREYLSFTVAVYLDKNNCSKLKVTSVRSIENIIKFLVQAPVKLCGNKKLEYILWIKQLRKISRYSDKIKIPSKY